MNTNYNTKHLQKAIAIDIKKKSKFQQTEKNLHI